jgi:hypothetical protein
MLMHVLCLALLSYGCTTQGGPTATEAPTPSPTYQELENTQTPTNLLATETLPQTDSDGSTNECRIGLGLRRETVEVLLAFRDSPGLVMSGNLQLAAEHYPELEGWLRTLGAPSLEELENKAAHALEIGLEYEGLSYGLETSETTPEAEWRNLVGSTEQARGLADTFGKLLVMGPGFRLMSQNEDSYPGMAGHAQVWVIQTQRLQINPPGEAYRQEVERVVGLIREGNPDIQIWAQITFLPDRQPDAEEWLAYRQSILDLVDGTYIGVYIWDTQDPELILETIGLIFETACGNAGE